MNSFKKIRSLLDLEMACISLALLAEARDTKNTVFQVVNLRSWTVSKEGGSKGAFIKAFRTTFKSQHGKYDLVTGLCTSKPLINLEISGWEPTVAPSNKPIAEEIADL